MHSSIHISNQPAFHPSIHSSIHSPIYPSVHPFMHTFIHPSINPSIHPSIHSFNHYNNVFSHFETPLKIEFPLIPVSNNALSGKIAWQKLTLAPGNTVGPYMDIFQIQMDNLWPFYVVICIHNCIFETLSVNQ